MSVSSVVTIMNSHNGTARLAQSVERQALNLMVVGSIPTVGVFLYNKCETNQQVL